MHHNVDIKMTGLYIEVSRLFLWSSKQHCLTIRLCCKTIACVIQSSALWDLSSLKQYSFNILSWELRPLRIAWFKISLK